MASIRPEENCPYCGLPDEADWEMVQCDQCDVWYHFRCAGVTRAIRNVQWICKTCEVSEEENFYSMPPSERSSLPSHTSSSIRHGLQLLDEQFQIRQQRLAEEKVLKERRLALEEEFAKQQNDLREEHLKLRHELLSSVREMSVGGSRVIARSQASMRSDRVRQWMDQQQNPAENPRDPKEPQGADPKFRTTAEAQNLAPLRNPDVLQQRATEEEGNLNHVSSVGTRVYTGYNDGLEELRQRNVLSSSAQIIENPQRPCPTPRKLNELEEHRKPSAPEQDIQRPCPAPRNIPDGLGQRMATGTQRLCPATQNLPNGMRQRSMPLSMGFDDQQPYPAPINAIFGMGQRNGNVLRPSPAPRNFTDGLGQRSAHRSYLDRSDFAGNHREEFEEYPANVQSSTVHRTIQGVSQRHVELPSDGEDGRARLSSLRSGEEIRGRCYDLDGFVFSSELRQATPSGKIQSPPHHPQYLDRDYGQPSFDKPHPNRHHNREEFFVGNEGDRQGCAQVGGITPDQLAARNVLPRKLPIFSGNYEEWPVFISCYNTTTEACGYTNTENLVRLQDCLREPALGHVRGRLLLPQSVPKVIETLQRIYGRPEQLLQFLLTKVRRCNPPKADRLETFIAFSLVIEQLCDHLEATNLRDHLLNPLLLQELIDKLPANTKIEWVRFKRGHDQVTLRTFADFMAGIAEDASEVAPFIEPRQTSIEKPGEKRAKDKGFIYTHDANMEQSETNTCRACQSTEHKVRNCEEFRTLAIADKVMLMNKWHICVICLNEHGDTRCRSKIQCNVNQCRERHHPLMHGGEVTTSQRK